MIYNDITYNDDVMQMISASLQLSFCVDMKCTVCDLEIIGLNPGQVTLRIRSPFVSFRF